jgi:hypothetical protein
VSRNIQEDNSRQRQKIRIGLYCRLPGFAHDKFVAAYTGEGPRRQMQGITHKKNLYNNFGFPHIDTTTSFPLIRSL